MIESAVVTGASGFIGSTLCRALAAQGTVVTGVGRGANPPGDLPGSWIAADLGAVVPVLPAGATALFHLAGIAHAISERRADEAEYAHTNITGTRHALDAAAKASVRAFVLFSSVKVFGDRQQRADRALTEDDPPEPDSAYGRSKLGAERLVLADTRIAHRAVIRPALVYGPGVKGNLARMRDAIARGRFPPLRDAGNRRSLVHVDDLASLAIAAASDPRASGRIFHATDGEAYCTRRLHLAMCAGAGRKPAGWTMPRIALRAAAVAGDGLGALLGRRVPFDTQALRRLGESAWFSSDRARAELGWKPLNTVESWCTSGGGA